MEQNIKGKTISGLAWKFAERCGAQGVKFVVSIIIANILYLPEFSGDISFIYIFINIMQVFVDSGLGTSLIQKKDADDLDFSSVFFFNLGMCVALYLIFFFSAPLIVDVFDKEHLVWPVRVLSLTLVVSGIKNVQQAHVSKNMQFKRFFYSTIGGTIISAVVGIAMAYKGFGVWALIAQDLVNQIISTVVLWFTVSWRPKLMFSLARLKGLLNYGWKLLASSLVDRLYQEMRKLIIGVKYDSGALAIYDKGKHIPELAVTNINTSIDSVLLPVMSSAQDDKERVKAMTRRSITTSCFIMLPVMFGICAVSKALISCLFTNPDWHACTPFLMVFSISYALHPIHTANLNAIKAMGRSDLFLILEIIKKVVGVLSVLITMWISPFAMAVSMLVSTVINSIINAYPNRKLLNYGYLEQIKDILPTLALSTFMCLACMSVNLLGLADWLTLLIQVPLGVAIYVLGAKLFKFEMFDYTLGIIKKFIKRK